MQITSKQGQWLGDIVVREAGSIEAIVEMAVANNISITDQLPVGTELIKPSRIDLRVINYYKTNNIYPATLTTDVEKEIGGIGAMTIGIDFIVR